MRKLPKIGKKKLIILAVIVFGGFILFLYGSELYVWPVEQYYKAQINQAFKQFDSINSDLKNLEITLTKSYKGDICDNGPFSVSSPCTKLRFEDLGNYYPQNNLNKWRQYAPELQKKLEDNGWHKNSKNNNGQVELQNLFDSPIPPTQTIVQYEKTQGKVWCSIDFEYQKDSSYDPTLSNLQFRVSEVCSRYGSITNPL